MTDVPAAAAPAKPQNSFFRGLAGRLLALTVGVVLIGEVVVFVPAFVNFHETWLKDRINLAQIAALALEAAPRNDIAASLQNELLANAEVKRVALKREGARELLLEQPFDDGVEPVVYDYTEANALMRLAWSLETAFAPRGRVLRVVDEPRFESGEQIEIVLNEAPLKRALARFAAQTLLFSTLVSLLAGAIVYAVVGAAFVRPMRRFTNALERFRSAPEDATIPFRRSPRDDEIGRAERAAADMADQIRVNLRQRERLALLGGAVARIAHDLRNMLSTAQIVTERLSASDDPKVRQIAPRLERAIGRAAGLASSTARFGRADEAAPVLQPVKLSESAREAAADALVAFPSVSIAIEIPEDLVAIADGDHVHRILVNLMRNAAQASQGRADACITVRAARREGACALELIDNGPGISPSVQERLFEPFASTDAHGAGLGLVIARELARAQGGDVALAHSDASGACFVVTLPGA